MNHQFKEDIINFAMENYQFAGTVDLAVKKGLEAGDSRGLVFKNLKSDFEYYNESLTKTIKTQLHEATQGDDTISVVKDGDLIANLTTKKIKINDSDTIHIRKIKLTDNHKSIKIIIDMVNLIIKQNEGINKFVVSPFEGVVNMDFDGGSWEKAGFQKLNDTLLIRGRH